LEKIYQDWFYEKQAQTAIKNLQKKCFEAKYVKDAKAAFNEIMGRVSKNDCIGLGDSTTLREIGIIDALENGGYNFLNPWKEGVTRPESLEVRRKTLTSDIFLTGTNAVTLDGKLVNIDGLGNRVAGMIFGPQKVVVVVGANKIVENTEEAIARIKRISAPVNSRKKIPYHPSSPPCAETGFCSNCKLPGRICCNTVIIEGCRQKERTCVIIIGESLGY